MFSYRCLLRIMALGAVLGVVVPGSATFAETLTVPAGGASVWSQPLQDGVWYTIRAEGVYKSAAAASGEADAEWQNYNGDWIENEISPDPRGSQDSNLDLLINGLSINWKGTSDLPVTPDSVFSEHTYSPSHVYVTEVLGTGSGLKFNIQDWYYADNSGSLTVTPEPATLSLLALALAVLRRRR